MPRITLKQFLVVTLAASAMAASTASAKPVDPRYSAATSSLAGTTESQSQDLRGEHAQDAARLAAQSQYEHGQQVRLAAFLDRQKQDLRGEQAQEAARLATMPSRGTPPVYWSYAYEAPKPPAHPVTVSAHKPGSDTDVWLILAIALGGAAVFAGTAIVVTRHWRIRVPA